MARRLRRKRGASPCKSKGDQSRRCLFWKKCIVAELSRADISTAADAKRAFTAASEECRQKTDHKYPRPRR